MNIIEIKAPATKFVVSFKGSFSCDPAKKIPAKWTPVLSEKGK